MLIAALSVSLVAFGQKLEPSDFKLPEEGVFSIVFDYSEAMIRQMPYDAFCKLDKDFEEDKKGAETRFAEELNEQVHKKTKSRAIFLPDEKDTKFTIKIVPIEIEENGSSQVDVIFICNDDNSVCAKISGIECYGGRFGSFANLVGDGYENLAKDIVYILRHKRLRGEYNSWTLKRKPNR